MVRERPMLISPWCFSANEFPSSFESIVRKILRLLYHVVAHIYHCHFREVALLGLHAHLNCVFAHLTLLNQRFNLIDPKETEILGDLEAALLGKFYTLSSRPSSLPPMRYWSMPITQCRREIRDWIARFKRRRIFLSWRSIGSCLGRKPSRYCNPLSKRTTNQIETQIELERDLFL